MSLSLYAAPSVEPLTIAEVKAHCRISTSDGEPAPTVLTVALAGLGAGNVPAGDYRYRATFVTADGETDGGAISALVTVADESVDGRVALTNIPIGGSAVTGRNIYRADVTNDAQLPHIGDGIYYLSNTIADNTGTSGSDNTGSGGLGAAIPATNTTADPQLRTWIAAARRLCETFTHRAFITQTWDLKLDEWPCDRIIWLPKAPLISVTSITYTDTSGAVQTLSASLYTVIASAGPEADRGRIVPAYQAVWPQTRSIYSGISVRFVAGYGAAASAVPDGIKAAMKLLIGHWYLHRESVNVGNISTVLPMTVESLLWPYKSF
jgi:uncharacterized phiE125 gp8 family phage protein